MPRLPALLTLALLAGPAAAGDVTSLPEASDEGSLAALVEACASALEQRARQEKVAGAVRVDLEPRRGIDAGRAEKAFAPRLKRRLKEGGILVPAAEAALRCRVALSEERGLVWATALCDGGALAGPTAVAVSHVVDKELEAALGATVKPTQTRFSLERLGSVAAGVLDIALVDSSGDGTDEVAVLGVDALRLYAVGATRLERSAAPLPLPAERRWPRIATGWLARLEGGRLWAVTSAGHSVIADARLSRFTPAPAGLVPLRGAPGPGGPLSGRWRMGSPVVSLPLVTLDDHVVRASLPALVRDVAAVPGRASAWVAVDEEGQLVSQRAAEPPTVLTTERVGDRIALVDLDGDGEPELVTTSPSAPGEADHLVLRRIDKDMASSSVVFRSPLSGGSIVALAAGRIEPAGRPEVILIEEIGGEALAWRLRYAP